MLRAALCLALGLAACTPGPGRAPIYEDAEPRFDATAPDANAAPDAANDGGIPDSEVVLFDSGVPPREFPFTGQYQIDGDQNRLFAREVAGKLAVMIGAPPYIYTGTIDRAGNVSLTSPRLARSGCARPVITGSYQRLSAVPFLTHESCGANGPFTAQLRGGFELDYSAGFSGVYRVQAVIRSDPIGCHQGSFGPFELLWGVSIGPGTNVISVYTAQSLVAEDAVYIGRIEQPDLTFAATDSLYAQESGADMSMRGAFTRAGLDAPRMVGNGFLYDADRQCNFEIEFDAVKVSDY